MATKRRAARSNAKKPAHAKKAGKLNTKGVPREHAERIAGQIIENALARSAGNPSETDAATALARAWLAKAGFHEDPDGTSPERIEIQGPGWDGRSQEHYVDVRVYIPNLDVEHVIDGTHPDGITAEAAS